MTWSKNETRPLFHRCAAACDDSTGDFDVSDAELKATFVKYFQQPTLNITCSHVASDQKHLITGDKDGTLIVWSITEDAVKPIHTLTGQVGPITHIVELSEQSIFPFDSEDPLYFQSDASTKEVHTPSVHSFVAVSPTGLGVWSLHGGHNLSLNENISIPIAIVTPWSVPITNDSAIVGDATGSTQHDFLIIQGPSTRSLILHLLTLDVAYILEADDMVLQVFPVPSNPLSLCILLSDGRILLLSFPPTSLGPADKPPATLSLPHNVSPEPYLSLPIVDTPVVHLETHQMSNPTSSSTQWPGSIRTLSLPPVRSIHPLLYADQHPFLLLQHEHTLDLYHITLEKIVLSINVSSVTIQSVTVLSTHRLGIVTTDATTLLYQLKDKQASLLPSITASPTLSVSLMATFPFPVSALFLVAPPEANSLTHHHYYAYTIQDGKSLQRHTVSLSNSCLSSLATLSLDTATTLNTETRPLTLSSLPLAESPFSACVSHFSTLIHADLDGRLFLHSTHPPIVFSSLCRPSAPVSCLSILRVSHSEDIYLFSGDQLGRIALYRLPPAPSSSSLPTLVTMVTAHSDRLSHCFLVEDCVWCVDVSGSVSSLDSRRAFSLIAVYGHARITASPLMAVARVDPDCIALRYEDTSVDVYQLTSGHLERRFSHWSPSCDAAREASTDGLVLVAARDPLGLCVWLNVSRYRVMDNSVEGHSVDHGVCHAVLNTVEWRTTVNLRYLLLAEGNDLKAIHSPSCSTLSDAQLWQSTLIHHWLSFLSDHALSQLTTEDLALLRVSEIPARVSRLHGNGKGVSVIHHPSLAASLYGDTQRVLTVMLWRCLLSRIDPSLNAIMERIVQYDVLPLYHLGVLMPYYNDPHPTVSATAREMIRTTLLNATPSLLNRTVRFLSRPWTTSLSPHALMRTQCACLLAVMALERPDTVSEYLKSCLARHLFYVSCTAETRASQLAQLLLSEGFPRWQLYFPSHAFVQHLLVAWQRVSHEALERLCRSSASSVVQAMARVLSPSSTTVKARVQLLQRMTSLIEGNSSAFYSELTSLIETLMASLEAALRWTTLQTLSMRYPMVALDVHHQKLSLGTEQGTIIVYDVKTGQRQSVLAGHTSALTVLSYRADGKLFLSYSRASRQVRVWHTSLFSGRLKLDREMTVTDMHDALQSTVRVEWVDSEHALLHWSSDESPLRITL